MNDTDPDSGTMEPIDLRPARYRGLHPNPEKLGVTLLSAGEASRPVRVRANVEVFDWLGTLGAAGIGQLLTTAYGEAQRATPTPAEVAQVPTVRFTAGIFEVTKPKHREIVEQVRGGGVLTQQGDTFTLLRPDGTEQAVHHKTGHFLVKSGAVVAVPEDQTGASTAQSPASRKRATRSAPGRRST